MAEQNKWGKLDQLKSGLEDEIRVELNKVTRDIEAQTRPLQLQIDKIKENLVRSVKEQAEQKIQILEADLLDLGFEEISITHTLDEHGLKIKVRAAG